MSDISTVDCAVRSARLRTSSATTAKPRPCSPARAASMAAFNANKLVWSAISRIVDTICPMVLDKASSLCSFSAEFLTVSAMVAISRVLA